MNFKWLVVDDDELFRKSFLTAYHHYANAQGKPGLELLEAGSVAEALIILQNEGPQLVVTDIRMPNVDGLQFLKLLQRKYPHTHRVILSGFIDPRTNLQCVQLGADLILSKPSRQDSLLEIFETIDQLFEVRLNNSQMVPAIGGLGSPHSKTIADIEETVSPANVVSSGFSGVLPEISLPDLVQMLTLSGNSCVLKIAAKRGRGIVYLDKGRIVHAESNTDSGEQAAIKLLSLRGGSFEVKAFYPPQEETIFCSATHILMESARLEDESQEEHRRIPTGPRDPKKMTIRISQRAITVKKETEIEVTYEDGEIFHPAAFSATHFPRPQPSPSPESNPVPALPPSGVEELVICSREGKVLFQQGADDAALRVDLMEFLSFKGNQMAQANQLGQVRNIEFSGPQLSGFIATGGYSSLFAKNISQLVPVRELKSYHAEQWQAQIQ